MRSAPLFYAPELPEGASSFQLDGDEARHAAKVRRLREGDRLDLGNGRGLIAEGHIESISRRQDEIQIALHSFRLSEPARPRCALYVAMPKGDRQTALIDMATQLGVSDIQPLTTRYSVVKANAKMLIRWQRVAVEAAKQSRRSWFPRLYPPVSLEAALSSRSGDAVWLLLDQYGEKLGDLKADFSQVSEIGAFIGPEAGFSSSELAGLQAAGARKISLGRHILRIETAAIAIISVLNQLSS